MVFLAQSAPSRRSTRSLQIKKATVMLDTKKPMVSNYGRFGLPASAEIARKYPDATAIGFMAGRRTGLTVLDIDTTDDRILADALDRHGPTQVIVRLALVIIRRGTAIMARGDMSGPSAWILQSISLVEVLLWRRRRGASKPITDLSKAGWMISTICR
jgi:hypothetical protein